MIRCIKILQARGYRRFGVIIPRIFERSSDFKRSAALRSEDLNIAQRDLMPIFFREETDSQQDLDELAGRLERHKPDCVLGVGKHIPKHLNLIGYTQPDRVGYAHLGWHSSYTGIAGMNPKWNSAGRVAVNLVIDQLTRNEHGVPADPLWILIEGDWVDGRTAQPPAARARGVPREAKGRSAAAGAGQR